jgi:hypothetical protein
MYRGEYWKRCGILECKSSALEMSMTSSTNPWTIATGAWMFLMDFMLSKSTASNFDVRNDGTYFSSSTVRNADASGEIRTIAEYFAYTLDARKRVGTDPNDCPMRIIFECGISSSQHLLYTASMLEFRTDSHMRVLLEAP